MLKNVNRFFILLKIRKIKFCYAEDLKRMLVGIWNILILNV